ncbi:MAG: serine hydrolase [Acidobacteriota bacterium]
MRWKFSCFVVLMAIVAPLVAGSEVPLRERSDVAEAITVLDRWIEQQIEYHHLPGLSIAVVFDQEIVWSKGYGYSDVEKKIPATPSTVYRMGSITKVFTSTAVMLLRDQGKLRLDDPVSAHLPWFRINNPYPDSQEITIRQLLTHTSGLPREADVPYWTDHVFPTREQLAAVVPTQELVAAPATTYHYSNLGLSLLGEIVAEVSGMSWAEFLEVNIFEPLGMSSSSGAPDEALMRRRATPYMLMGPDGTRDIFDYYDAGAIGPAANMVSTVSDIALFVSLQFSGGPADGAQILKGSTVREMHQVHWVYPSFSGGRGLGFSVSHRDGKNFVGHGGWIGGNRSSLMMVPQEKIAVIAILNADDRSPSLFSRQAYEVVGSALLNALRPEPVTTPEVADPAWENFVGRYADPWGWEYEILILDGRLVEFGYEYPPDENASAGYTPLVLVEGTTFRRPDNEKMTFELDDDGTVVRIKRRNDYIFPKN